MVKWVNNSIKDILVDNCQKYLQSKDLGRNKARMQLIKDVEDKIREAVLGYNFPPNLNKVCCHFPFTSSPIPIICHSPSELGFQTRQKGSLGKPANSLKGGAE